MATQLIEARRGKITAEMKQVALIEEIDVEKIVRRVARGLVIIPRNVRRKEMKIIGIGAGLKTKVNVNIGTSTTYVNLDMEIEKAKCYN